MCEHLFFLEPITHVEDEEENTEPMNMRCSNLELSYSIVEENEQERYVR